MQINVSSPDFSEDFLDKVKRGKNKGAEGDVVVHGNSLIVVVEGGGRHKRNIGNYVFDKDEDNNYVMVKRHTIEKDYFPFEAAIYRLVRYLKRKKENSFILWH